MKTLLRVLVAIPVLLVTLWWALALYFSGPGSAVLQVVLAASFALGTVALLDGDVAGTRLVPVVGALPVGRVAAEPHLLDRWSAPPERVQWWRDRVAACHALLVDPDRGEAAR